MQKIQILIFFESALYMKSESMPLTKNKNKTNKTNKQTKQNKTKTALNNLQLKQRLIIVDNSTDGINSIHL